MTMKTTRTRAVAACVATVLVARTLVFSGVAYADAASPAADAPDAAPPAAPPARGLAVVAAPGAQGAAWTLAKEIYAKDTLRPVGLDESRARVLAGESPVPGAPASVRDLADERGGVHGDDGASRALLKTIAAQLGVRALVLVSPGDPPSARVYLADTGAFDAARYEADAIAVLAVLGDAGTPDAAPASSDAGMTATAAAPTSAPPAPPVHWTGAVASIERAYGLPPTPPPGPPPLGAPGAPALAWSALPPAAPKPDESHPFYASPWFWAAVGAAVFGGTAVYFATRDNSSSTVHLELQVH